jgi:hypothetical protein
MKTEGTCTPLRGETNAGPSGPGSLLEHKELEGSRVTKFLWRREMTIDNKERQGGDVRVVPTGGCADCGGRCVLKVHVKDGVAIRVETDDGDEPQLRACARGRALNPIPLGSSINRPTLWEMI